MNAIGILDCNNFFVSCERAVNPSLNDRPVVVLSHNDGCVISRSDEVKEMGVKMAQPLFQVKAKLEKHNTAILSSNHSLYRQYAEQIHDLLIEDLGKQVVELYSIDEAFLDLGSPDKLVMLGNHLKKIVFDATKIPVSVGIAETKTLAKIANHLAKTSRKTQGVLDLYNSRFTDIALEKTPIRDVWGVGSRSAAKLMAQGLSTALDLKRTKPEKVRRDMTIFGSRTVLELNGIKCIPIEISERLAKSIAHTRSFGRPVCGYDELKKAIIFFTTRALEKMRWNGLQTRTVTVFLHTDRFRSNYYAKAYSYRSVYHSDVTSEIYGWVDQCLAEVFVEGMEFKKAGVILSELQQSSVIAPRLFDEPGFSRRHHLAKSIDELNMRYGRDVVHFAALKGDGRWQGQTEYKLNDENHTTGRDAIGKGQMFRRSIRFM
jgi:DNA polymerase V